MNTHLCNASYVPGTMLKGQGDLSRLISFPEELTVGGAVYTMNVNTVC